MFNVRPIGLVQSPLKLREHAPKQGSDGTPEARLLFSGEFRPGLGDIRPGDELLVLTWLHRGNRDVLQVHPKGDPRLPLRGVFSTRSPDRPKPIGIHRVRVLAIEGPTGLRVAGLEAFDETPIVDVKPVLDGGER